MGRPKCFIKEDVLESAIQLFWKKGYADTSLADLEKATGVNKSGLYSEFADKEDLFVQTLTHYQKISPVEALLEKSPKGWDNIEALLKASITHQGQKGCYFANTLREFWIVPEKVRTILSQNTKNMHRLVVENIRATSTKKDPDLLAQLILTFTSGISLKLNAVKPAQVEKEIEGFLAMVKS